MAALPCDLQIALNSYDSVEQGQIRIEVNDASVDIEDLCATPYRGGTACTVRLVGSSVPGANDRKCCPTDRIIGRAARR